MKLLTLNLRHNADRWEERFSLVVELLHSELPEVIALQEAWLPIKQAESVADELNRRFSGEPYTVHVAPKWGGEPEGIALLSRLPVLDYERLELPEGNRVAQRIVVEVESARVNVANAHLHHRPIGDEAIRLRQMQTLLEWMFNHDDQRWLLTGDMNALPESTTIEEANKRLDSAYYSVHGEHPITFPTPLGAENFPPGLALTLDYIFYDPATLRITAARVIADNAHPDDASLYPSDHYGLVAEVEIV